MIEAIVAAALVKIAEGSGAALVDMIRRRFVRTDEPAGMLESLDRVAQGDASADDTAQLRALLARYAAEDPEFLRELRQGSTSIGSTNVVASSNVGKLVQAQRVGDITM
ncbi:hypothetical protein GAR06_02564 [Micromonospora saelicesensis]|uniref:hypothetical protein n=1 Tax=Micromonospora saelicesensis TaxID=285676 RepID=UPI000DC59F42|nr:hypothetical protein [Micromonospora saelicesensis]RAO47049.1 hypothetical protein GAR06_02564 [Micromonospora saelicesensis]